MREDPVPLDNASISNQHLQLDYHNERELWKSTVYDQYPSRIERLQNQRIVWFNWLLLLIGEGEGHGALTDLVKPSLGGVVRERMRMSRQAIRGPRGFYSGHLGIKGVWPRTISGAYALDPFWLHHARGHHHTSHQQDIDKFFLLTTECSDHGVIPPAKVFIHTPHARLL